MVVQPRMTTRNMFHMNKHPTTCASPIKATFNDPSSQTHKLTNKEKLLHFSCCYGRTLGEEREGIRGRKRKVLGFYKA